MSTTLAHRRVAPSPVPLLLAADLPHADREVRAGSLVRVVRGVYAPTDRWRTLAPWNRYLARVHAVALVRPDAVFVLESAAALWGLPIFGEPADVHVILPGSLVTRRRTGIHLHSTARMPRHTVVDGIHLAEIDEVAVDLARARHPAVGLAVAGTALRLAPEIDAPRLEALNDGRPSTRGSRHARWALSRASAVPESSLEHASLAAIEWLGFSAPRLQRWFRGTSGPDDRVDFWWEQEAVAGEADGMVKYSGEFGDARQALRARNARDARLRTRGVRAIAHWGWDDILDVAQLRAILTSAGLRQTSPEHTAPLRTLAAALRSAPPPSF